ncbi:UDP-N-acetylglucosamine--undecaprenyl-phosphate N-acetylglucosaminephosphotransferase [Psychromonas sp. Urea-02u-13]|uniref:UDP-N-acetylglucosamine--undecaprenyl-phosphate N-acetylglucosaminephosphotransferase n=1 Tax=Psychromonas sp. Urea-02u-13 TaxID=2058326 RepID=UPI000C32147E|nr:UDP-N-acetylglucosamine--undecaprenyl-phosphate N-acetylglucosaminephosphotransferase [Psychromonas sp. Urea-02u-13]PKG37984.1 undecaprenyl-phosphate alpha-N-acetylglucosaminyl 1-phosphate transferase [Psychromonas sp. Urea-02u-13]
MIFPLIILIIAFVSSLSAIILLRPFAIKIGLTDKPNFRKVHAGHIPLIGGISVYIGLFTAGILILFFSPTHVNQLMTYLFASLLMVITGALDDRFDLSVKLRIAVQVVIASIMMFIAGDVISDLGNILYFTELPLSYLGYPFTIVAVLAAINAYNMVDGIDGLIGGVSVATFISLTILFVLSGDMSEAFFCLLCLAVLIPYFLYNLQLTKYSRKKIFMGDAGSMFIGFTVVWLLAIGTQKGSSGTGLEGGSFKPVVALWIIALPLIDMVSIMLRRMGKGVSPFQPDRDHLHHIFMRAGFSSRATLIFITFIALCLSLIGVATTIHNTPEWMQLVAFIALFLTYKFSLSRIWRLLKLHRKAKAYRRLIRRKKYKRKCREQANKSKK